MLPPTRRGERLLNYKKSALPKAAGCAKGRLNSKLHAVCDGLKEILSLVNICVKRIAGPQSRLFLQWLESFDLQLFTESPHSSNWLECGL